jgi:uncharacterized protein YggE
VLSLTLTFAVTAKVAAQTASEPPSIVVRGEGKIIRNPEVAWLRAATTGRGDKSEDARKRSADAMTLIQASLKRLGIPESAMRTTSYVLQPQYDYVAGASKFKDFSATNSIEIRIDDLTKVIAAVDAVSSVTFGSVESLRFDLKDPAGAKKEAIGLAVGDAMATARAMAQGAGKALGELLKMQEDGAQFSDPFNLRIGAWSLEGGTSTQLAAAGMPAPPATPIIPGPITIVGKVVLMVAVR